MFNSVTPQSIVDDVNALTDNDGYSLVSLTQLVAWINKELLDLWQWATRCNRDAFTKCTSAFSLAGGTQSISMTAASPGLALTDWLAARAVDIQVSSQDWKKLRLWNFTTRDRIGLLSYRFLGETLWIQPIEQASVYPLRVWYLFKAPVVTVASLSTAIVIPDNAEEYVKQGVAAKLRVRLDDDPGPHLQAQAAARLALEAFLASSKGDQGAISDVSEEVGPELW